jgi:hypothetical protein
MAPNPADVLRSLPSAASNSIEKIRQSRQRLLGLIEAGPREIQLLAVVS